MKHVSTSANEVEEVISSPKSQANFDSASKYEGSEEPMEKPFAPNKIFKKKKQKKQKLNVYEHFSTMVENNSTMLQQFAQTNVLFKNMDAQIGRFMSKL
jgi:hypothetical protein